MKEATKRSNFRWIHIIFGIPVIGYIYDSPTDAPNYAWAIRYVFFPVLLISGLSMWKGHVVRRLVEETGETRPAVGLLPTTVRLGITKLDRIDPVTA